MAVDKVSFTSRINFVDAKTFEKFRTGSYIDFRRDINFRNEDANSPWFAKIVHSDIVKAKKFYTDEIRTCTAGGVIDSKTGECAGFHFFDSLENHENTDLMLEAIFSLVPNPDRALILGGKKLAVADYSMPIFEKILKGLKSKIENVTVFKEHFYPFSESDLQYNIKKDTWTIHSMYRPLTEIKTYCVNSKDRLKNCFKEVEIAKGDSLDFICI